MVHEFGATIEHSCLLSITTLMNERPTTCASAASDPLAHASTLRSAARHRPVAALGAVGEPLKRTLDFLSFARVACWIKIRPSRPDALVGCMRGLGGRLT